MSRFALLFSVSLLAACAHSVGAVAAPTAVGPVAAPTAVGPVAKFVFNPVPPPSLWASASPGGFSVPVEVSGAPIGDAGECACDASYLECAPRPDLGRLLIFWNVSSLGDWPSTSGRVATCTDQGVSIPVVVGFTTEFQPAWQRGGELVIPVYQGAGVGMHTFALPAGVTPVAAHGGPDREADGVWCKADDRGVLTVDYRASGVPASRSYPCVDWEGGGYTVTLLPFWSAYAR